MFQNGGGCKWIGAQRGGTIDQDIKMTLLGFHSLEESLDLCVIRTSERTDATLFIATPHLKCSTESFLDSIQSLWRIVG